MRTASTVPLLFALLVSMLMLDRSTMCLAQGIDESDQGGLRPLINLDSPLVHPRGIFSARLDMRAFGGDEDLFYTSLGIRIGLGNGWEGLVRGSFADRSSLALPGGGAIRHGGSDMEVAARYALTPADGMRLASTRGAFAAHIGVSFPSTPAQGGANLTLGASAGFPAGRRAELIVNPRVTFIEDNTLFGLGIGGSVNLGDRVSLVGEYTPILSGNNTRDTATGSLKRRDLYGLAIRFHSADDRFMLDLGYTNGVGATTGFSLTPGLGGSGAFYLSVRVRR